MRIHGACRTMGRRPRQLAAWPKRDCPSSAQEADDLLEHLRQPLADEDLTVRVNHDLTLETGWWEQVQDQRGPERLVHRRSACGFGHTRAIVLYWHTETKA